jgi:hypothetical protein
MKLLILFILNANAHIPLNDVLPKAKQVNIIEAFPGALEVMELAYQECGPTWDVDPSGDKIRTYWDKGGKYELRYSCNPKVKNQINL